MCSAIFEGGGPVSLLYPFVFPCQLKNWLHVQGLYPSFSVSGNKFFFVVPGSSRRKVGVLRIFFFLTRRVLSAALPLTRHGMHPLIALEKSTLRPLSFDSILILLSGFPEAIGIPGLLDAIGLDAVEELVAIK